MRAAGTGRRGIDASRKQGEKPACARLPWTGRGCRATFRAPHIHSGGWMVNKMVHTYVNEAAMEENPSADRYTIKQ